MAASEAAVVVCGNCVWSWHCGGRDDEFEALLSLAIGGGDMFDKAVANQTKWSNPPFHTNDLRAGYGLDRASNLGLGQYYGQKGGNGAGWGDWIQFNGDWGLVVCLGGLGGANWGENAYPDFPAVMNLAQSVNWGSNDLFPEFGMPSLA